MTTCHFFPCFFPVIFDSSLGEKTEERVLHCTHNNPTDLRHKITRTSNKNLTQIFSLHFLRDLNQLTGPRGAERTCEVHQIKGIVFIENSRFQDF